MKLLNWQSATKESSNIKVGLDDGNNKVAIEVYFEEPCAKPSFYRAGQYFSGRAKAEYATRTFEDSRLFEQFFDRAVRLSDSVRSGDITAAAAAAQF